VKEYWERDLLQRFGLPDNRELKKKEKKRVKEKRVYVKKFHF